MPVMAPGVMMFDVLILICLASLQPGDCNRNTAIHVLNGPPSSNEVACAMQSQAYLASTAIGRGLKADEYVKIRCVRQAEHVTSLD